MAFKVTIGSWTYDSKKGQWTRAKKNRRKHVFEYESRTRAQREKDLKEREQAREDRKFEQAKKRQERLDAVKAKAQGQPATVTQVRVVSPAFAPKAVGGQPSSAQTCGAPTKAGGRCMRAVAPGQTCPIPAHRRAGARP